MKKRVVLSALAAFAMAFMLVGCGGNDAKTIDGTVNNSVSEKEGDSVALVDDDMDEEVETNDSKGYVFEYDGQTIVIDDNAASTIAALGEPVSYFEAASCAFEGLDKMYTYSSFELDTYPTGDDDFVSAIIFKDDSISTPEGIRIGSSLADVTAAYGDSYEEEVGQIVYTKDGMTLTFVIADDTVASIEYNSTVLD